MHSIFCSSRTVNGSLFWLLILLLVGASHAKAGQTDDAEALFDRGVTWQQFLSGAKAQREAWLKVTSNVDLPADLVERFRRASEGLRILIVAEDWCTDSLNAVPYIAELAASASIPLRIVGRMLGQVVTNRHRTPDGRTATPTVILLHDREDVGAWIERPAIVQEWFQSMATNPESARQFSERHTWYESDRGHTVLTEVITLAERAAEKR